MERRVLIIENADAGSPEFMDALLKPMEDRRALTTLILLASDLEGVRKAGQSRCTVHRLRRLTDGEMTTLCFRSFRHFRIRCEGEVALKGLVACCKGLPGRLLEACQSLGVDACADAATVKKIADADWTHGIVRYWSAIFGQSEPREDQLGLPAGTSGSLQVARSRTVIFELMKIIGLAQQRVSTVGPLLSDEGDQMQRLVGLLRVRSNERGIPVSKLIEALSELYLREDYDDLAGFQWLGLQARRLVAGPAPEGVSPT
jgi:hypothetical protein